MSMYCAYVLYIYNCPCTRHESAQGSRGIGPRILNFSTEQMWSDKLQSTTVLTLVSND